MLDTEFWNAVGRTMASFRVKAGWETTKRLSQASPDAPRYRTLDAIESGRPGHVQSLGAYCYVLQVSLRDVLASALPAAELSADSLHVARMYEVTDAPTQAAIRAILQAADSRRVTRKGGKR